MSRSVFLLYALVLLVWLLFDSVASATGSFRGEAGFVVCAMVLAAAWLSARLLSDDTRRATSALGLSRPTARSLAVTGALSCALIAIWLGVVLLLGAEVELLPGAWLLALGMFAQGGIAEEALFRGLLFGTLRAERSFWPAAWLAVPPFLVVHVLLFFRMEPVVAATATLLSLVMSFPLARLYEIGGRTIWAPAILHAVVQGTIKIVELPPAEMPLLAGIWMLLAMLLPWTVFLVARAGR